MSPQQGNDSNRRSGFQEEELDAWLMSDPNPEEGTTLLPTDPEWQTWFANDSAAEKARMEDSHNTTENTLPAKGNVTEHTAVGEWQALLAAAAEPNTETQRTALSSSTWWEPWYDAADRYYALPANGGNMMQYTFPASGGNINSNTAEHIFPANGNNGNMREHTVPGSTDTQPNTVSSWIWWEAWYDAADHSTRQSRISIAPQPTTWTRSQNKAFEMAIATCPEGMENRWERIAALVPGGKTPAQLKEHHDQLLHDLSLIHCRRCGGLREAMAAEMAVAENMVAAAATNVDGGTTEHTPPANGNITEHTPPVNGNGNDNDNRKKSKNCHWTEEEQRLFLTGFKQYGKAWTTISRHYVVTRTPEQVASHAQKYFLRQSTPEEKRKRKSIHDITIENI